MWKSAFPAFCRGLAGILRLARFFISGIDGGLGFRLELTYHI